MTARILVVDDEPDVIELVSFLLRKAGYEAIAAHNASEALNRARADLPDLILLDVMLPELDGIAVCEILRRLPSTAGIPVVMLTAWRTELARVCGLEAGANDYVTKPFDRRELLSTIRKHLTPDPMSGDAEVRS